MSQSCSVLLSSSSSFQERTGLTTEDLDKDWIVHSETPFNAVTKRTMADVTQKATGVRMMVSKGAPQVEDCQIESVIVVVIDSDVKGHCPNLQRRSGVYGRYQ